VNPFEIVSIRELPESGLISAEQLLMIPQRLIGTTPAQPILPDSEVVYSPSAIDFDVKTYINTIGGYLSSYTEFLGSRGVISGAEIIEKVAIDNSINPRVLLSLLEYQSHWVLGQPNSLAETDYPMGHVDLEQKGLQKQLTWAVNQLSSGYYRWRAGAMVEIEFRIFRQERIGLNGRRFEVLKFRSMRPVNEQESQTNWSIAHDNRVGPVGRFIRKTSIDELPQLWNILRGEMTVVGPRPERPFFVEQFSAEHPEYAMRHRVPVGLTGLAQVSGLRGDTSISDRARFDNYYVENWSLWLDVKVVLRTAAEVFRGGGGK
jgi:hypothetical protein